MRISCRGALRLILLAVLVISSPCAFAQRTLSGLTGTVTDASGAVLMGAKVQLTGDSNGISLTTTSQRNGVYQFQNLPVGAYTLVFTRDGFGSRARSVCRCRKTAPPSTRSSRLAALNTTARCRSRATALLLRAGRTPRTATFSMRRRFRRYRWRLEASPNSRCWHRG